MKEFFVYPNSVRYVGESKIYMIRDKDDDKIVVEGPVEKLFEGKKCEDCGRFFAPKTHANAEALRSLFDWTAPKPVLRNRRSMGVGDRLGIACPGHIRVFNKYDMSPIFAQQSIRELNLTERTYEDVLDCVTFSVFREGFTRGFGADGDHLKTEKDIEYALGLKFSMLTLDCSEHIRGDVSEMSDAEVDRECELSPELKEKYLGKSFEVEDNVLTFTENELKRIVLIYGKAIDFAAYIYEKYIRAIRDRVDFELSIDETATPTSPLQHYFVARELTDRGVGLVTVAPRFCGEFQKGIDYIGDLKQFEAEMKVHAAIARHFGYKLSIHSGSDKFSTFEIIGKYTQGNFHVKTAGTNWLEAMRAVAAADPKLYREVHKYALTRFEDATKYYHVTTDLSKIPDIDKMTDEELPSLFTMNDARQLIHITYGFILTDRNEKGEYVFKDRLYKFWRENEEVYAS
ncbi:MAG: tagaturonate epimerase family protein, partial [Clostridia bacterium]|nr:tagaturonate epimerase family protein [Clostridia bacterium]